jgi:hypothetical protein
MRRVLIPLALFAAGPALADPRIFEAEPIVVRTLPLEQSVRLAPDADVSAYSNLAVFNGYILTNGGVETQGGNTSTLYVADDISV